jgi:hypothetical protein
VDNREKEWQMKLDWGQLERWKGAECVFEGEVEESVDKDDKVMVGVGEKRCDFVADDYYGVPPVDLWSLTTPGLAPLPR